MFALWIKDGLLAVGSWGGREIQVLDPQLDWRVLGFTLALSFATGIIFGLAPAWRSTRLDLIPTLKDSGHISGTASNSLLRRGLVIFKLALSFVLLVGAVLFLRTLINLQRVDPGFNTSNLLLFEVAPRLIGYEEERLVQFYEQMTTRLENVPGVQAVTFSRDPLLTGRAASRNVYLPGAVADLDGEITANGLSYSQLVHDNFLQAMEIPLLGVALGSVGAAVLTGLITEWLFGVRPTDPETFAVVVLLLTAVAILACWIPAQRATNVDPMVALRYE